MGYTDAAKHSMLAHHVGKASPTETVTDLSLHSADPGTTGANENNDDRVGVTEADFDAPTGGEVLLNNDKAFTGPAEASVTHFGTWNGTTFLGGGPINVGDLSYNAAGEYVLQAGTSMDLNS